VSAVNEPFQRFVIAVIVRWRKQINAVVAPIPAARTFGDRHHFDQCDSQIFERVEFLSGGIECTLRGERADVELVHDLPVQFYAFPLLIAPDKSVGISHHGRSMRPFRLKTGTRVGTDDLAVQAVSIKTTRTRSRNPSRKIAVTLGLKSDGSAIAFQNHFDGLSFRRPNSERDAIAGELRSKVEAPIRCLVFGIRSRGSGVR
jgi:hypothetical protein